jgi:NTP pyrophosphatase (non-canonical NTP hydrolase)
MTLHEVLLKIIAERAHQDKKLGEQRHSLDAWMTILTEEVWEVAKAINQLQLTAYFYQVSKGKEEIDMTMIHGLEDNIENELVQAAAVAIAFLQFYDFNHNPNPVENADGTISRFDQEFAAAVARAFNDHFKETKDGN